MSTPRPPITCCLPLPQFTGRCQWQPRPDQTLAGWYIDTAANYNEAGFIDAPERIPCGSVRAIDSGRLRLMCADVDCAGRCARGAA